MKPHRRVLKLFNHRFSLIVQRTKVIVTLAIVASVAIAQADPGTDQSRVTSVKANNGHGKNDKVPVVEDWPRWRGPHGNGEWQAPRLPHRWPEEGLPAAWKKTIGAGYAGISVVGDRVYTMDRLTEPREVERVLCLNAATGETLWQHQYPVAYGDLDYGNGPRAAPTIHDGRVYTLGAMGHAHCLEAASGKVIWKIDFVADHQAQVPTWGLAASPVIWNEIVIFHAGVRPDGCFTAHERSSGKLVWRASADPAGYCTPIVIETESGEQLLAWSPEHVQGIDLRSGRILWSHPYPITYGVSITTPIFRDGIALVSSYWHGAKAFRLGKQPTDSQLIWEEERLLRGVMSQPLYRDGLVYLLERQHGLSCFELASGKVLWSEAQEADRMTPRERNPHAAMVWLGDADRAIILNAEGELILARLNRDGYHEQSRTKIIGRTWAHPAFAGKYVFARDDQEIVCVQLPIAEGE